LSYFDGSTVEFETASMDNHNEPDWTSSRYDNENGHLPVERLNGYGGVFFILEEHVAKAL
jgi:hypothetical protein